MIEPTKVVDPWAELKHLSGRVATPGSRNEIFLGAEMARV
jgi:hypothetical protein